MRSIPTILETITYNDTEELFKSHKSYGYSVVLVPRTIARGASPGWNSILWIPRRPVSSFYSGLHQTHSLPPGGPFKWKLSKPKMPPPQAHICHRVCMVFFFYCLESFSTHLLVPGLQCGLSVVRDLWFLLTMLYLWAVLDAILAPWYITAGSWA